MRAPRSPWTRAAAVLLLSLVVAAPAPRADLPFEQLAKTWRETHGVLDFEASYDPFEDFQPVLERAFSKIRLGMFEVHLSRSS